MAITRCRSASTEGGRVCIARALAAVVRVTRRGDVGRGAVPSGVTVLIGKAGEVSPNEVGIGGWLAVGVSASIKAIGIRDRVSSRCTGGGA